MKLLLWDFDGTLGYREGMWTDTLLRVLREHGETSIARERLRPFLSGGFPWDSPDAPHEYLFGGKGWWEHETERFAHVFELLCFAPERARELAASIRPTFLDLSAWRLFDDTLPALRRARELGFRQAILSNHVPELRAITEHLGLSPLLDEVFSSALVGWDKPNPRYFAHVLEALGTTAADAVMVGDNYSADVAGALLAGIRPILVRSLNEREWPEYRPGLDGVPELADALLRTGGSPF